MKYSVLYQSVNPPYCSWWRMRRRIMAWTFPMFAYSYRNTASSQSKLTLLKCYFIKNAHKFVCSVNSTIIYLSSFFPIFRWLLTALQKRFFLWCSVRQYCSSIYGSTPEQTSVSTYRNIWIWQFSPCIHATSSPIYSTLFSINWQNCELAALTCPYWFIPRFIPCHYWSMN